MLNILFSADPASWDAYHASLTKACSEAGLTINLARDHAPEVVDYIIFAPDGPVKDFSPYTRCKAVMSLWAGVETVVDNSTLTQPLVRMVDDSLTFGMTEWVVGHVLRHHLGMDTHIHGQDGIWRNSVYPPLAHQRPVTILGCGALGAACGKALAGLGFDVTGWSRNEKNIPGLRCLFGEQGLTDALTGAQIVVLLLPDTPATRNTLNDKTFALLAEGACVINPGRGTLIDDTALLAALDSGQVGHATLDVFRTEPLPPGHPFWVHPKVTVTPHIAASTRPETASTIIAGTILRAEAGEPLRNVVDRSVGY